jgi:hypothetical protein
VARDRCDDLHIFFSASRADITSIAVTRPLPRRLLLNADDTARSSIPTLTEHHFQCHPCSYVGFEALEYPFHDRTVTVTRCGRICLRRRKINLSKVFAGQNVWHQGNQQ